MNRDFLLVDEDWGCVTFSINFNKIDVLPRITLSDMTGATILNVGLFMLTLNLCVLDRVQREMNRRCREARRRNAQNGQN